MFKPIKDFSFDYTLDAVIGIDRESRIIEWNKKAEEYFGWSKTEVLAKDMPGLIIPQKYRDQHRKGLQHFLKTGEGPILNRRVEVSAIRRNGEEFEVELAITPVNIDGQNLFYAHLRDISVQKQTAQRLATQNRVMSILVEGTSEKEVTPEILKAIALGLGFDLGVFWRLCTEENRLELGELYSTDPHFRQSAFFDTIKKKEFRIGEGAPGRVWQEREPVWVSDIVEEENFPRMEMATQEGFQSGAWFPVVSKDSVYGVFEFMTKNRQAIDDELIVTFIGLGQQIGQFLEKQYVLKSLARRNLHSEFLANLSKRFEESSTLPDTEQTLQQIAEFLVPTLCDWCTVRLKKDDENKIPNVAIAHVNPAKIKWAWELTSKYPGSMDSDVGALAVIRSGRSEFFPIIPEELLEKAAEDSHHLTLLKEIGFYSWICVPLKLEDKIIGAISLVSTKESKRIFNKGDLLFAEELARRAASIIETHRLNLQTREAERSLRLITDAVPALISYVDRNENYKFVNKTYEEWFGVPREKLIGSDVRSILGEESYEEIRPLLAKVFEGQRVTYEMSLQTSAGSRFVKIDYTPDVLSDGHVQGYVALTHDVSSLEKAKKEAQIANRAKTEFLANMSHEIRTPLGAILGFSELMIDHSQSASDRLRWNSKIKANGEHLLRLVSDILDLSKIESGKVEIERSKVILAHIFRDVIGMFEPHSKEKGIDLKFSVKGKIPDQILTDAVKLKQVLINVVGNAVKFTQTGGVIIEVFYKDLKIPKIFVSVEDTGPGLTKEQSKKVFEPFVQGDSSATRKYEGTGLGLALARSLAKKLGGDVVLKKTTVNEGTKFLISIQAELPEGVSFIDSFPVHVGELKEVKGKIKKVLTGVKVLVVDDLSDNQLLVSVFLRRAGASVELASSGFEAIDKALSDNFDIILMDVQMPELDGHEATRKLRQQGYRQPIVALTAHALKEEIAKSLEVGCNAHITKPIVPDKLISTIDQLVH